MPVSKKPRKKGRRGHKIDARKKLINGKFRDLDDARKTIKDVESSRKRRRQQCAQLGYMLCFTEKEALIDAFTMSLFAVDRLPTTPDYEDFNHISSSLMLGALCHKAMGVQEQDLLEDIQHACYMMVVCARLRNHRKTIPAANLEPIRHGIIVSQELMEYAYENERQALINVLKHNSHENLDSTPGLKEAHERFILGKHYEQVQRWEIEDDGILSEVQKTGRFPEVGERE